MKDLILKFLMSLLNADLILGFVKLGIDFIEAAIKSSATDWDDKIILPILEKLKEKLGIITL